MVKDVDQLLFIVVTRVSVNTKMRRHSLEEKIIVMS